VLQVKAHDFDSTIAKVYHAPNARYKFRDMKAKYST